MPIEKAEMDDLIRGKSDYSVGLLWYFINEFKKVGPVSVEPAKTMIGIATSRKRIAYVTQLGKSFIHVVFPFRKPYPDNFCFQKIAQVPTQQQFNHHCRILRKEDINAEVKKYMKLAYTLGKK